jgi:Zn-dependent M28 family amino/carboxypeptidase
MERLLRLAFALVLLAAPLGAQRAESPTVIYPPEMMQAMRRIQQAALADDYGLRQASHLSNNIGPRLSGSPQAQKSVEYLAAELRKLGLEVTLEKVMVPHWVRGEESAQLVEWPGMAAGTTQKVYVTALGGSVATPPDGIIAEVVVVKDFDELKALPDSAVRGKIVVYNHKYDVAMSEQGMGFPAYGLAVGYRGRGASEAAKKGAVASLIRSAGFGDRLPHTGMLRYEKDVPQVPGGAIANEDADMIAKVAAEGKVRMRLVMTPQSLPEVESANVIADLKGAEHPEQIVIVSGHLDSWDLGTGAIDDAVGTCAAMQAISVIKKLGLRPKRTIRFIAWMNEENGLRGGRTYAENQKNNISNHVGAIEADAGTGHPIGFGADVDAQDLAKLRPVAAVLESMGAGVLEPDGGGADISPLTRLGVASYSPSVDQRTYFRYHHTAADTFDKIEPQHMAEQSAVIAVLAYALAEMPEPLPRKAPAPPEPAQ